VVLTLSTAYAQTTPKIPPEITTPDKVQTGIGTLEFKDGAPNVETVRKMYDSLDFVRGVDAFMNRFSGASAHVGSQYLMGFTDAAKNPLDGGKTHRVTLPPNIPAAKFWSFTVYDNQTRSMLQTPQRYPRAGSQTYPSPAAVANADGSTTIYFGPSKPADAKNRQLDSDAARQGLVHAPAPLQPGGVVLR